MVPNQTALIEQYDSVLHCVCYRCFQNAIADEKSDNISRQWILFLIICYNTNGPSVFWFMIGILISVDFIA